jgi:hypothetical protein
MYTAEITKKLIEDYLGTPVPNTASTPVPNTASTPVPKYTISELAKKYGKSEKSIVGKLSKEKVYVKQVYRSKTGAIPETKKEIIARLAEKLRIDPERIQGLEKAPKLELILINNLIERFAL